MIVRVADYDFPDDLIDLQRAWFEAEAECARIADELPRASEIIAGTEAPEDLYAEQNEARARRDKLTHQLQHHDWWDSVSDRADAKMELRKAARQ